MALEKTSERGSDKGQRLVGVGTPPAPAAASLWYNPCRRGAEGNQICLP